MSDAFLGETYILFSNNKAYNLNPCGFGCTPCRYLFYLLAELI